MKQPLVLGVLVVGALLAGSQTYSVKIISRQSSDSVYGYVVPGYSQTNTTVNANCAATPNAANCTGTASSNTSSRPAVAGTYRVAGATFTLQLPDGRLAVVNCNAKTNWTEWSTAAKRSCRIPIVDEIEAEFDGDKAKLKWPVSIDGKKFQSETYKIIAILKP